MSYIKNQASGPGLFAPVKPEPLARLPPANDAYGSYEAPDAEDSTPTPNSTPTSGRRRSLRDIFSRKKKSLPAEDAPPVPGSIHDENTSATVPAAATTTDEPDQGIGMAVSSTDYANPRSLENEDIPVDLSTVSGGAAPVESLQKYSPHQNLHIDERPARMIESGGPWGKGGPPQAEPTTSKTPAVTNGEEPIPSTTSDIAAPVNGQGPVATQVTDRSVQGQTVNQEDTPLQVRPPDAPQQHIQPGEIPYDKTDLAIAGGAAVVGGGALAAGAVAVAGTNNAEDTPGVPSRSTKFYEEPDEPSQTQLEPTASEARDLSEPTPVMSQDSQGAPMEQTVSAEEYLQYLLDKRHSMFAEQMKQEQEEQAKEAEYYKAYQTKQKLKKVERRQSVGKKIATQFKPPVMREYIHKFSDGIGGVPYDEARAGEPPSTGTYPLHGNVVQQFPVAPSDSNVKRNKSVSTGVASSYRANRDIPPGTAITTDSEVGRGDTYLDYTRSGSSGAGEPVYAPSSPSRYSTDSRTPIADQFSSSSWYRQSSQRYVDDDAPPVPQLASNTQDRAASPSSFYEQNTSLMSDEQARPEPLTQGSAAQTQSRDLGPHSEPSHSRQASGSSSRGIDPSRMQAPQASARFRAARHEDPSSIPPVPPLPSKIPSTELPTDPPERRSSLPNSIDYSRPKGKQRHSRHSSKSKSNDNPQDGTDQTTSARGGVAGQPNLDGIVDLTNTEDVSYRIRQAPAVTHEIIQPTTHHIIEERIEREVHTHDVHHRILPIVDVQVLPAKHFVQDPSGNGNFTEVSASSVSGRAANEYQSRNWVIAETVSGRNATGSVDDLAAGAVADGQVRRFTARAFTGTEGDAENYTTADGVRHTKTTWVHSPQVATAAQAAGETVPVYIGFDNQAPSQASGPPPGLQGPAGVMAPFPHRSLQ